MCEWGARAAEPRQSENLQAGLTWGEWGTVCCTVHLSLLFQKGAADLRNLFFRGLGSLTGFLRVLPAWDKKMEPLGSCIPQQGQQKQHGTCSLYMYSCWLMVTIPAAGLEEHAENTYSLWLSRQTRCAGLQNERERWKYWKYQYNKI